MKPLDEWTDADIEAFQDKWDAILRGVIIVTYLLCSGMILWGWTNQSMRYLLGLS